MSKAPLIAFTLSSVASVVFFSTRGNAAQADEMAQTHPFLSGTSVNRADRWRELQDMIPDPAEIAPPDSNARFDDDGVVFWDRKLRPFEITQTKGDFSWTAEDGKSDEVMKRLANNEDMLDVLRQDNAHTKRRQLIYFDEESFHKKRDQILNGEGKTLTLPGFDGQEIEVTIGGSQRLTYDNVEDPNGGFFGGQVTDDGDSHVMIGTAGDSYSIQIDSSQGSYRYDMRENGELILSELDREVYGANDSPCTFGQDHHLGTPITN